MHFCIRGILVQQIALILDLDFLNSRLLHTDIRRYQTNYYTNNQALKPILIYA
nr:MAG TPA: hypothetical protein [Bacteriophage sp.]